MTPGQVWGATPAEIAAELPCDALFSGKVTVCDRAITVAAPPDIVFAWLCQLRVAPYSYDLLDNFGRPSPRRRDPALTELVVGQRFMGLFDLVDFAPNDHITLSSPPRIAVTYAVRENAKSRAGAAGSSRLHVRVLFKGPRLFAIPLVFGDFLMMRKQLLTLAELAEREAGTTV
ncbi:hypothetical protein [Nocardia sp. NPDC050406]|uniref:hypothetical protein n=1 Tax=Nocardia sp. NPDC050406 TaxID=3364318 RepID=UPI00378C7840